MADPAKSNEIEDVLSSIRRLVSDHQSQVPSNLDEDGSSEAEDGSERLVLTAALRVTDPEDPWIPIIPQGEETAEADLGEPFAAEETVQDTAVHSPEPEEHAAVLISGDPVGALVADPRLAVDLR